MEGREFKFGFCWQWGWGSSVAVAVLGEALFHCSEEIWVDVLTARGQLWSASFVIHISQKQVLDFVFQKEGNTCESQLCGTPGVARGDEESSVLPAWMPDFPLKLPRRMPVFPFS